MRLTLDSVLYRRVCFGLCLALATVAIIPAVARFVGKAEATARTQVDPERSMQRLAIAAPGRIRPRNGIVTIAAPAAAFGPAIVAELQVGEGDRVERDQLLAVLRGRDELEAELATYERRVDVAQARLNALQAGGKREDIAALRAELQSEEANAAQIAADTRRADQLRAEHALSAAALEAQQARSAVATRVVEAKRARLAAASSVRPVDVAVAAAELAAAQADIETTRARLANQYIRAPSAGRVLRIDAYPGQAVGPAGLLAFAETNEMFVDAEVVEQDITRVLIGQAVRVTGESLGMPLEGTVERIGSLVGAREVFAIDPTAFSDSRIVHVLVRLKDATAAERFINARVTVEIES